MNNHEPSSMNFQAVTQVEAVSKEGFPIKTTFWYETRDDALNDLVNIPRKLTEFGYKAPEPKKFGGNGFQKKEKEYVEGRVCPKCGARIVKGETKNGKKFIACETRKWNMMKKETEGCGFIEWQESFNQAPIPSNSSSNEDIPFPQEMDSIDRALQGESASEAQRKFISNLIEQGKIDPVDVYGLSKEEARRLLSTVKK